MKVSKSCLIAALLGTALTWGQVGDIPRGRTKAEDGVEVLTRGPVHEAFAETITFDPEPGVVVMKSAPEAIEEVPPDQKPAGANVDWIPGYWAWDDERSDFLWVSGIWRSLPPGRQWVSGYWAKSGRGSQWTSGYWADAQATEVDYLPEPPETVEAGPNIGAPSPDHTWLPGCWVWQQNRYAWRPGFWATAQPNWVWIPAHYVWAPRGYVFIDGYYDYSVPRRGVLFAPVYFHPVIFTQRGFSYSPVTVINPAVFTSHLFLRPSYGHYYFGDYYGSNYSSMGFSPWFSFYASRSGYDPFYAQQRWHHRNDDQWDRRVAADFAHRRDHQEARPPRTWTAQRDGRTYNATNKDQSLVVAASLDELASSKDTPFRFQPVNKEERLQIGQRGQAVRESGEQRQKLEAAGTVSSTNPPVRTGQPVKMKLPKTPIVARTIEPVGNNDVPPKVAEAPRPDSKIEPKPRQSRGNRGSPSVAKATKQEPKPEPDTKAPQAEPKPQAPKAEPKPPKAEPKPEVPKAEPKPPKAEPKPQAPKAEPKPPKAEPKPEAPKAEPKPPKAEPKPEAPKAEPKPPKAAPKPEAPKAEPKPPKAEKPQAPKAEPKPPKAEPNPQAPKAERNN